MQSPRVKYLTIAVYILVLLSTIFLTAIFHDCSNYHPVIKEGYSGGDTIDIAIIYGPRSLYIRDDSLSGIDRQIALRFGSEANVPVKIWPVANSEKAMDGIREGKFDIFASLPLDNYVREQFLTSESLYLDRLVLIQLADSSKSQIVSPLELNGKTVHVSSGSPALLRLTNLSKEIGGMIEIKEEHDLSDELLCIKVAQGEIPYAVVNEKTAEGMSEKYPQLSFNNPVSFTQFQVWIFNLDNSELVRKFEEWFTDFKESDDYRQLIK